MSHKIEAEMVDGDDAEGREDVDCVDQVAVERERRWQIQLAQKNQNYLRECRSSYFTICVYIS